MRHVLVLLDASLAPCRSPPSGSWSVLGDYLAKAMYELSPPMFRASSFSRSAEQDKQRYLDAQCKGVLKHDRDLMQFLLLADHTEPM